MFHTNASLTISLSSIAIRFTQEIPSIKERLVISTHSGITKEWLNTALTHATDVNDMYFLEQSLYTESRKTGLKKYDKSVQEARPKS
jgi:hypothetical protein